MYQLKKMLALIAVVVFIFAFMVGSTSATGINHHVNKVSPKDLPAPLCKGSNCYNLDPITEKCWDNSAYITDSTPIYWHGGNDTLRFVIDNWYSADCNANWNETYLYGGGIAWASIANANGEEVCYSPKGDTCNPYDEGFPTSVGSVYTNMVDGSVKAQACAGAHNASIEAVPVCGAWR
jgi:hypothetical protein